MSDTIEKIIFYFFGALGGIVLMLILVSFSFAHFEEGSGYFVFTISALGGMLLSSAFLEQQRKVLAEEAKKTRDETVALITHEMRTGLTSTGWAIEFILENYGSVVTEEHKKMLEVVVKSISTTVMHSVNLLDVSLLDIGKLTISREWVKLSAVENIFTEILIKYKLGAKQNGITIFSEIQLDQDRQVEVDMLRLRIVLENLLENAIQYASGPEKKITVRIRNDASSLHINVEDNGMGIPLSEQNKIFSEFFRASNARKKLSTGSGIGLHMCYQYVKAHGGTMRFESKEGVGTTFFITLPLKTVANVNEFLTKI